MENPRMSKFLDEFKSMNCKFERPVAAIMPNMTQNTPPIIGSGIVMKRAPNFDKTPKKSIIKAAAWITLLLPTLVTPIAPIFSE